MKQPSIEQQQILFDLDDTLIHCNKYFFNVIDQSVGYLQKWFKPASIDAETIREKQCELDIALVTAEGFASHHFPESLVETYRYFAAITGYKTNAAHERTLYELGLSVYDQQFETYPNMQETLEFLQNANHQLYLYTGGEHDIQWRKIKQHGLERFFDDRVFITRHKTADFMQHIIESQQLNPDATWMIGNSLRTDVVPALQCGINTIHIPIEHEWQFNHVDISADDELPAYYTVQSISDVPVTIQKHLSERH